ncbi:NAD(P)-dependent oxidoreductase [Herbaspirillum sp. AP02]|uniref:NAD(P)-dependent oxidoreductase n=1 Tax=unclassified Herbaspirillum TaxID=2624150 RepID=UPI0015DB7942|nr:MULTISPECIES: NAD(P)-dependent oxidoreductase [unclassified Herbaspirillum]MBG7620580.1 NAD(P)-dependent oxidoreductase [Herbaspirillum sp. AP02]NZD68044.1 NAD(P)-dependent oxidoreductase [Herbaspirillum sp. AP21]
MSTSTNAPRNMQDIGFVGTGIMGLPMAGHLARAGLRVRAWNRTPSKAAPLAALDVQLVAQAREVAAGSDAVICMLSSGPACDEVLLGPSGLIAAMRPGALLVVMSSIPVATAQEQARVALAHGVHYMDAPVSGGEKGAREAALAIMAGGDAAAWALAAPLLRLMGRPTHVGPAGCGQLAKLVNQMMVAANIASVAEAMLMAERGGADPARVREALLGGFADSTALRQHALRMIQADFKPGGPAKYQLKDTRTAVAMAGTLGLSLPMLETADRLFEDMVASGDGELDHSAIIAHLRRINALAPADGR